MSRALKSVLAGLAGLTAACVAATASAQAPSLVGVWSHHVVQGGRYIAIIWDEFSPDGKLHTRLVTPKGTIDLFGEYRVLKGGLVRAVYNDWSPKQFCTLVCTRNPPPLPIGKPSDTPVRFNGPNVAYFGPDMYTRHKK